MRKMHTGLFALSSILLLSGCVSQPLGPSFSAMPPQGKSLQAFDADDAACQQYAGERVAGRVKAANDSVTTSTIVGTAIGAGLGAAVGNTRGAVVGGAAGAAIGNDASGPGYKQAGVQREYDASYAQCMTSRGNTVPTFGGYDGPRHGYRGDYGPPPPPGYGPPPPPPGDYPPPPPPGY
jgi:hypothetical protein